MRRRAPVGVVPRAAQVVIGELAAARQVELVLGREVANLVVGLREGEAAAVVAAGAELAAGTGRGELVEIAVGEIEGGGADVDAVDAASGDGVE